MFTGITPGIFFKRCIGLLSLPIKLNSFGTNYEKSPYRTQTVIVYPNMGPDVAIYDPLKLVLRYVIFIKIKFQNQNYFAGIFDNVNANISFSYSEE